MANSFFRSQFLYQKVGMPVRLYLKATIGASGAVTIDAPNSSGILSITKESTAGQYTILLPETYNKFLGAQVTQVLASGIPAAPNYFIKSADVASAKTIVLQFTAPAATMGAYTPAGTNSAPTFTGSALAGHAHTTTATGSVAAGVIPVTAGTAGDAVTNNAGVLESTGGQDLTVNAQAFTGNAVLSDSVSAGTPVGTVSAPIFTGNAATLTSTIANVEANPSNGQVIYVSIDLSNSSVTY